MKFKQTVRSSQPPPTKRAYMQRSSGSRYMKLRNKIKFNQNPKAINRPEFKRPQVRSQLSGGRAATNGRAGNTSTGSEVNAARY